MNPFFSSQNQGVGPFRNMAAVFQQFNAFKQQFRGDPKSQVEELVRSGKMSQSQFQQLSQMAQNLRSFLG